MVPQYPSLEELQAWSALLQHEVDQENEAARQLAQHYFRTDYRDRHAVEDLWWALVDAADQHEVRQYHIWEALAAYGDPTDPLNSVEALQLDLLPDLTPPSGDQVFLAAAAIRMWRTRVLGTPLVRYVLDFFEMMSADIRLRLAVDQQRRAWTLLKDLVRPLFPPLDKGLFSAQDLTSIVWLLALLRHYNQELPTMKRIVASSTNRTTLFTALRDAYPEIPCEGLRKLVQDAGTRYAAPPGVVKRETSAETKLRPAYLTEALMARQYGLSDLRSTRKALTRAAKAQHVHDALSVPTCRLVQYLCFMLDPRQAMPIALLLLLPPPEQSGN
jgi:hypothetical protein